MEAEASNVPALSPFLWHGVGGGLGRHVGMKGGVETGHLGQVRKKRPQCLNSGQARWVVQGGQVGQGLQGRIGARVEQDGLPEGGATVDNPVPGCIDGRILLAEGAEHIAEFGSGESREVLCGHEIVVAVEQAELEGARTGIDDEDVHTSTLPDRAVRPSGCPAPSPRAAKEKPMTATDVARSPSARRRG